MIAIIDYDKSSKEELQKALKKSGIDSEITDEPAKIQGAEGLVLTGSGRFHSAMESLTEQGLVSVIQVAVRAGTPILGIGLGMELLVEGSLEDNYRDGLGLIPGLCERLPEDQACPLPHQGLNQLIITNETLLNTSLNGQNAYFDHSYYVDCEPNYIDGLVQYSIKIPAMISSGNIYGVQFEFEKSSDLWLEILRGFKEVI